jgi:hypothetical protein
MVTENKFILSVKKIRAATHAKLPVMLRKGIYEFLILVED